MADSDKKSSKKSSRKKTGFQGIGTLFDDYQLEDKGGYITREFQDYGYRLAVELDDLKHKSLYIKMAKDVERSILERARSFISDANATSKAKLFMWKVKQLKDEAKEQATMEDKSSDKSS
jgi:hypothetical protein